MGVGEQPHKDPAVRMPNQHVGWRDACVVEESPQVGDLGRGVVHTGDRRAVDQPGAVIGAGACRMTQGALNLTPVINVAAEPASRMTVGLPVPRQ